MLVLGRYKPFSFSSGSGNPLAKASFVVDYTDGGAGVATTTVSRGGVSSTFTRATSGTTILSNGNLGSVTSNVKRATYSPAGVFLGYLAEGQRTNICLQSQDFNTAAWTAVGTPVITTGSVTLGILSLDTMNDDSAAALEGVTQTVAFTGDAQKAISIFVRQGTSTSSVVRLRDTTAGADRLLAVITWSGAVPVVTMTTGSDLNGTPQQHAATGIYRLSFLTTAVTAANTNSLQVYPATDNALSVGNTGTIQWGGVQVEDALTSSTYIPTTTTSVTRNADAELFPTTGWYNAAVGTAYGEGMRLESTAPANSVFMACVTDANGRWIYQAASALATTTNTFDGTTAVQKTGLTNISTASRKRISAWDSAGLVVTGDGAAVASGAFDGSMGAAGNLGVGTNPAGAGAEWFGTVRRIAFWPQRLPNNQLQQLTT